MGGCAQDHLKIYTSHDLVFNFVGLPLCISYLLAHCLLGAVSQEEASPMTSPGCLVGHFWGFRPALALWGCLILSRGVLDRWGASQVDTRGLPPVINS